MRFIETRLAGVFEIEPEPREDERGFFARSFCQREFGEHGLPQSFVQCNVSHNRRRGTLRGLHYQAAPHAESKLVSCTRGRIFDVVVDLRPGSATLGHWHAVELVAETLNMIYVPEGCAHGFQALVDECVVFYQMSEFYYPDLARGIAWNDPAIGIAWPLPEPIISKRDAAFGPLSAALDGGG